MEVASYEVLFGPFDNDGELQVLAKAEAEAAVPDQAEVAEPSEAVTRSESVLVTA